MAAVNLKCLSSFDSQALTKLFSITSIGERDWGRKGGIFLNLNNNSCWVENINAYWMILFMCRFYCFLYLTIANGRSNFIYVNFTFLCKWSWYLLELKQLCWHLLGNLVCVGSVRGEQLRSHSCFCCKQIRISASF